MSEKIQVTAIERRTYTYEARVVLDEPVLVGIRKGSVPWQVEEVRYRVVTDNPRIDPGAKTWGTLSYTGHNVKKDGTLGAERRDSYIYNADRAAKETLDAVKARLAEALTASWRGE